ncbi:hypothetical protein A2334_02465 [Candidatus Roizmanbacteria bacterium RIFOXYB2_FULL_38_10]|uniref:Uncharacterized protein n=1 Tax=Candidatus Roizmanbacteria bacterium RIFOXYD1_FULL_38_12 TaxID=1802093 RepID=A0A1F7KZZ9_9BACT|nr:MAG: hypothetical protein A3K47_01505 [Candidatus Roizmanbacteria bacterium RIFOXYA2_FULL_38_14]OGK63460.1 MAG: hypothetical protein A3K27_01505 [Candidatus Roizmanbacteria bacterium RIFOXYA1_FULL_37_12]OGK65306.1 MAG: hypothetical protein A3K38_01505 [Candidatus Roizmanbacteria bacterium RIFOXYB1_FULL_40_23]OGK67980.1 MAG: hypothetical protein A2334_02465 [Candidatus Roizmanbacteria bacterium RIFOXYB2_FULL_38_10]OGK69711.1 MAG: hypothetical protein A3K21_01510 [Candidatus Roizmanbacteria ba
MKNNIPPYQNKKQLRQAYQRLGSTRKVARLFNVSNGTIICWMRKFHISREPKLYLSNSNSGRGRLCELYIVEHPYFTMHFKDLGEFDDKSRYDGLWFGDRVNIKSSHSKKKFTFRIKKIKHDVVYYICCIYIDEIDPLIPTEVFIIPAKNSPRTSITATLGSKSKYAQFRLSLKRGKEFTIKSEREYNEKFKKKYRYPTKK